MTREEAIKVIRKMLACTDLSVRANLTADMVDACHMAIKALEQEPKIGHKVSGDLLGGLYCSECMTYVNEYFNYCPHCGAKIESEDKK